MSVQDNFAGRQGNCPRCKQPFTVPQQSVGVGTPSPRVALTPPPPQASPPQPPPLKAGVTQPFDGKALRPPAVGSGSMGKGAHLEVIHGPEVVQGKTYALIPGRTMILGRDPLPPEVSPGNA